MMKHLSVTRENMRIEYNVPIPMEDGAYVMCNLYFPLEEGVYPVVFTAGAYGKDLYFPELYPAQWNALRMEHPDVFANTTAIHMSWEVVDPEKWCPDGYICMRVDSRGFGCTPGYADPFSRRETQDMYNCIEWAAAQPWCNGKVGMNGISYFAVNQWQVAELQPPHLAAICVWEGNCDYYRELTHHGGIYCSLQDKWQERQGNPVQYGLGDYGFKSKVHGMNVSGDETLSEEELRRNRCDIGKDILAHPMYDDYYRERNCNDFSKIKTPLLSAGNWGGQGLHLRGNIEGFMRAGSEEKYLEIHGLEHWTKFYCDDGLALQKQFLGYYLKGEENGWKERRKCQLHIRHIDHFEERWEDEWPLARTQYTKLYFQPESAAMKETLPQQSGSYTYRGMADGVTFISAPLEQEIEITGHSLARLTVSSETEDADVFVVLRAFAPDMREVTFSGANDRYVPLAQGCLRLSHRKLDETLSTPWRPYYSHDELQPLTPGKKYTVDIDLYPTCIVLPKGYRLALTVRGNDHVYSGITRELKAEFETRTPLPVGFTEIGLGALIHDDPFDRPAEVFDHNVTLHIDVDNPTYLQIPIIPKRDEK